MHSVSHHAELRGPSVRQRALWNRFMARKSGPKRLLRKQETHARWIGLKSTTALPRSPPSRNCFFESEPIRGTIATSKSSDAKHSPKNCFTGRKHTVVVSSGSLEHGRSCMPV
eukprot:4040573-Prymnesium_polylepis.1